MDRRVQAHFDADTRSVRDARTFVATTLRAWRIDDLEPAASLLAGELATNAVVHAGTPYRITLELGPPNLRVLVEDLSPALPTRRSLEPTATSGRGLSMVDALALDWGARPADEGKVVWFDLTADQVHARQLASATVA